MRNIYLLWEKKWVEKYGRNDNILRKSTVVVVIKTVVMSGSNVK